MNTPRDDDEDWFEALAGRPQRQARPVTAAEARCLREALLAQAVEPAVLSEAEQRRWLQPVAALARQAPATGACAGCTRRRLVLRRWWSRHMPPRPPLLAAGLAALLAVWLLLPMPGPEEAPQLRAPTNPLVATPEPRQQRDALAAQLAALGADVRRYERLGRQGLEARFPQPLPAAAQRALASLALQADADGVVLVEFEAAQQSPP